MKFLEKRGKYFVYESEGEDFVVLSRQWKEVGIAWDGWVALEHVPARLDHVRVWTLNEGNQNLIKAGHIVVTDTQIHEDQKFRYIVYNPLSSLPITQTYSSKRQARHVAEAMAKRVNEPFFVAKILYGLIQDDNYQLQEVPSDNCR